jgi:adenylate cyclase
MGTALAEHYLGERLRSSGDLTLLGRGRIPLVEARFGPYAQIDPSGYQMLLDFHGGRNRFRKLSLDEVMRDDAMAPMLRGRIILVGIEATSVKDSFPTPLGAGGDSGEPVLGVALHAYLADQLIRIHAGEQAGWTALAWSVDALIIWACAIVATIGILAFPGAVPGLLVLLTGLGLILASMYAGFGRGLLLPGVPAMLAWVGTAGSAIWVLHAFGQRDRLYLRRSFEHYLDSRIIDAMLASGALPQFGGEHREISVLFTDIANFTALAEATRSDRVATILQDYFDGLCAAITACGGLVAEFAGDSVLALFGAPQRQNDHADRAVDAALRMDAFACNFREMQRAHGIDFGVTRIGLHTGIALVGNIGTRARLKYGAIGDVMNTASRIESLNKRVGTRIAVSGETARRCTRHSFRPIGEFVLRGRQGRLLVTTPLTPAETADNPRRSRYQAAYAALQEGDSQAAAMFRALWAEYPADPCIDFHCRRLAAGQVGVHIVLEEK